MRIVVVEDEGRTRTGLINLIEKHTNHIIAGQCKDGKEGLEICRQLKPDLVITDIRMPAMSGIEMLMRLKEEEILNKAIVLSGYAEFEYAQKAIVLGVNDYLLKPVSVDDVCRMIENVEKQLQAERTHKNGRVSSALRDLLSKDISLKSSAASVLSEYYSINEESELSLFLVYMGRVPVDHRKKIERFLDFQDQENRLTDVIRLRVDEKQYFFVIVTSKDRDYFFEEALLSQMNNYQRDLKCVAVKAKSQSVLSLHTDYAKMETALKRAITEKESKSIIINADDISKQYQKYTYPADIETKIVQAICSGADSVFKELLQQFEDSLFKASYSSEDVLEASNALITSLMNVLKDVDSHKYQKMVKQKYIGKIANVIIREELHEIFLSIAEQISNNHVKSDGIRNYLIKKAINYIRLHYYDAINLETVAIYLDISPEYLSKLFYKEMNVNFTSFLKEFRISHAKRLLIGTNKKIFEIAAAVGYNDPKYFTRVFKEIVGMSPAEFRQLK